ncbi:hypothetical protein JTE90_010541 [Oedothorax gibbosus]|uniref:C2H2-type domain-containing protein n=1 Tax=Oedothorax gibbosus TaxID=931172 RepID=A0AAV6TNW2_9ARAC|nr:hypothetical protein JTE90_010541 [Oedothorax gibbosus]
MTHFSEKKHVCKVCGKAFHFPNNLRMHISNVHKERENKFICGVCDKVLSHKISLQVHLKAHLDKLPCKCETCKKEFKEKNNYKEPKPTAEYVCELCFKRFRYRATLESHFLLHTREKAHKCNECGECFSVAQSLRQHILRKHSDEHRALKYTCVECSKSFLSEKYLLIHTANHSKETLAPCQLCKKAFSVVKVEGQYDLLTDHVPNCEMRNKALQQLSNIQSFPQGEGNAYACDACNKIVSKETFMRHLRSHTGEKPYKCDVCNLGFASFHNLKGHSMKKHDKELQISKKISPTKPFSDVSELKQHLLTHTKEQNQSCEVCDEAFNRKERFESYLQSGEAPPSPAPSYDSSGDFPNNPDDPPDNWPDHEPVQQPIFITQDIEISDLYTVAKPEPIKKRFQCHQCKKSYSNKHNLKLHSMTHSGMWPHVCHFCGKGFLHRKTMRLHMLTHTRDYPYKCDVCDKQYPLKVYLQHHMLSHTGEKPYVCHFCNKRFSGKYHVQRHIRAQHFDKIQGPKTTFSCKLCGKTFGLLPVLKRHLWTHASEVPFKCDICNKSFSHQQSLKVHMKSHLSGKFSQKCELCSQVFSQELYLRRHIKRHHPTETFPCSQCDKVLASSYALKNHLLFHSGVRPYQCEVCDKTFTQKPDLDRHSLVHQRICKWCNKKFPTVHQLMKHRKSHSEETTHDCHLCDKKFVLISKLRGHLVLVHGAERPFQCELCPESFKSKAVLTKHMVMHKLLNAGQEPHDCKFCSKVFSKKIFLRKHMSSKHPNEEQDPEEVITDNSNIAGVKESNPKKVADPSSITFLVPSNVIADLKQLSSGSQLNDTTGLTVTTPLAESSPQKAPTILLLTVPPPNPVNAEQLVEKQDHSGILKESFCDSMPIEESVDSEGLLLNESNFQDATDVLLDTYNIEAKHSSEKSLTESNSQKAPIILMLSVQPPNPVKPKESDPSGGVKKSSSSSQLKKPIERRVNPAKAPLRYRNNPKAGNISAVSIAPSRHIKPKRLSERQGRFYNPKRPSYNRMMFERRVSRLNTPLRHQNANCSSVIIQPPSHVLAKHLSRLSSIRKESPHSLKTIERRVGPVRPLYQQSKPQNTASISSVKIQPISPVKARQSSEVTGNSDCQKQQLPIGAQVHSNIGSNKTVLKENSPQKPATISSIKPWQGITRLRILQ